MRFAYAVNPTRENSGLISTAVCFSQFIMTTKALLRTAFLLFAPMALSSCFDSGSDSAADDPEEAAYLAEKGERDKIKARVDELKAEKSALETTLKELESASGEGGDLAKTEVEVTSALDATRAYASRIDALAAELDVSLATWREATRASFKGVKLPEITTIDGKKYMAVTINAVTDDALIVEHSGGMETIPVMQLPVGLRKNVIHEATVFAEQGL
jgi:hypothetical protein